MKILCVTPSYWPAFRYGGPIVSVHGLNKALVRKMVDVTVYTTNVGIDNEIPINQEVNVEGVKVYYFEFSRLLEFLGNTGWQFSWQMTKALKKNLKTFDVIHLHAIWNYPTAAAAYYCRINNKPYIIAPRGALYSYTIKKNLWKKWPYYYLVAKRDLDSSTAIHYTTQDEKEKCHSRLFLKNKAVVIPNGIEIPDFTKIPRKGKLREQYPYLKGKQIILFLGRINWKKGLDLLVKAYAKLARERDDVHLVIAGPDEGLYEKKVKEWCKVEGILGQVTFTGLLKEKEKLWAYRDSDIFVLPSYSENFGIAVIEALAYGTPVVLSNSVGIYREVEKNEAGVIVGTNLESLYGGIKALLDNENLRKKLAENGKRMVKEYYEINRVADMMAKCYQELLTKE